MKEHLSLVTVLVCRPPLNKCRVFLFEHAVTLVSTFLLTQLYAMFVMFL